MEGEDLEIYNVKFDSIKCEEELKIHINHLVKMIDKRDGKSIKRYCRKNKIIIGFSIVDIPGI